ncbi:MAG: Oxidoreductase [Candidatus Roizmanbacteria bacterium GW2011_GWA2_37_7]|uniref:Oxidoreductase n=1 Tax=Candidatus Roizmanbacteria bacterium GW2011_GWA2_37_7 TaxID=1618481 RepID=A0A0G0KE02_9BACT|nr:MAG: Oxidoreductase [Candidatus Roizmanbacteria bacterium GW2011_GWA2_37_7]
MKKINVAVIGTGNMGQHHVRVYSRMNNTNLVAVCDQDIKRAQKIAQEYGCTSYQHYHDMIASEKIDAVSIAVPTFLHHKISLDMLENGKHLLIEKPISTTLKEAQDIIDSSKKNKRIVMVGHIERFNPAIIELKKLISKDIFGKIITLNTKRVGGVPSQIKNANVMLDLAIHDIDISNYLLDDLPNKVMGFKSKNVIKEQEDSAIILLKYRDSISVIENNWITPVKVRTLDITGTKAFARLDYIKQSLFLYADNFNIQKKPYYNYKEFINGTATKIKQKIHVKKAEPLKLELEHFIDYVIHNKQPEMDAKTAYNVLNIALKL